MYPGLGWVIWRDAEHLPGALPGPRTLRARERESTAGCPLVAIHPFILHSFMLCRGHGVLRELSRDPRAVRHAWQGSLGRTAQALASDEGRGVASMRDGGGTTCGHSRRLCLPRCPPCSSITLNFSKSATNIIAQ